MSDVIQKVTVTPLPNTAKTRLAQTINDNTGIGSITGVLDTRFDDVRYYTGDSA